MIRSVLFPVFPMPECSAHVFSRTGALSTVIMALRSFAIMVLSDSRSCSSFFRTTVW